MAETTWWSYVQSLIGDDSPAEAASRAGFDKSAFTRWKKGANADPAFVVRLARAYGADVLEGLVAAGTITSREAGGAGRQAPPRELLRAVPDEMLVREVMRRIQAGSRSSLYSVAVDGDSHDYAELITLNPAASDADGDYNPDAEVEAQQDQP